MPLALSPDATGEGLVVSGGLLIEQPGWYRFALDPPCAPATLTIDELPTAGRRPLLTGVHPFALTLPDAAACALPVQLLVQSQAQPDPVPMPPGAIVSPAVAAVPAAQAPAVVTFDGYGEARQFVQPAGRILDVAVDADGTVFVLVQ